MTKFDHIHTQIDEISQKLYPSYIQCIRIFQCFSFCFILFNSTPQILIMSHWINIMILQSMVPKCGPGVPWCTHDNLRDPHGQPSFIIILKHHLPYSLSFSDECTVEFSRSYMIWWCHTLTDSGSYACVFFCLNFFSALTYNTVNINKYKHINKSSLGFSVIFKNLKGSWDQKLWELLISSKLQFEKHWFKLDNCAQARTHIHTHLFL